MGEHESVPNRVIPIGEIRQAIYGVLCCVGVIAAVVGWISHEQYGWGVSQLGVALGASNALAALNVPKR
jgi:hypothetical protein